MPFAESGGVRLYYEDTGDGVPIIFVHEFAGDCRSWEPQVRFFGRRRRCVTFNARGYPPSDVPGMVSLYSQVLATDDIAAVLRHLGIDKAHVVGISMGAFAALHFAIRYREMALSAVVAAGGYGTKPGQRDQFVAESLVLADRFESQGSAKVAEWYAEGAYRVQFKAKDPRGWEEFRRQLAEHSAVGAALTMRGVQSQRPSFWDMRDQLAGIAAPVLIVAGDEDDWGLDPAVFLKRTIPTAGLWILPKTGHTINLEEPAPFNDGLQSFFDLVENGRWPVRDPRVPSGSALFSGEQRAPR